MKNNCINLFEKIFFISLLLILSIKTQASDKMGVSDSIFKKAATQSSSPGLAAGYPFIELIFFSCQKVDNEVHLEWRTASEINNEFFIPEKSSDSTNFIEIGYVKGAGKSLMVNDYSCQDPNYEKKVTYYRLKFFQPMESLVIQELLL